MNIATVWTVRIIFILLFLAAVLFFGSKIFKGCGCSQPEVTELVPVIPSNALKTNLEAETKRDTVVKWYEKIIYKESKPKVIYEQIVSDPIYREKIKAMDVMLKVNKVRNKLNIYAYNHNDSLLKEYVYEDVGSDFTATSRGGSIFVKSKKWYWQGINAVAGYRWQIADLKEWKNGNIFAGLRTGIDYMDKAGLNVGGYWDFKGKKVFLQTELNLKILK